MSSSRIEQRGSRVQLLSSYLGHVKSQSHDRPHFYEDLYRLFQKYLSASISDINFIEKTSDILRTQVKLFEELDFSTLLGSDVKVSYTLEGKEIDLVTIITPAGGEIYPVSHNSKAENPIGLTVDDLRNLLMDDNGWKVVVMSVPARWVSSLMELVQEELHRESEVIKYRRNCLNCLRKLAFQYGELPQSFHVRDLASEGTHPVTGGGFADIWRGRCGGEVVCMKVLRIFTTTSVREKVFKALSHEALIWKQLRHPNILPFLGVNLELFAPSYCLVSPWMANGNLMDFLERNPNFDTFEAIVQICKGMRYLHEFNPAIGHGDIKCANVLITNDYRCCLADFGVSLFTESQAFTTSSVGIKGSVRWLSPEVIDADRSHQRRPAPRDIYAFGCTILEIFTRKPPFSEIKLDITVANQVSKGHRPSQPKPKIKELARLWNLVEACWSDDPQRRPSAADVEETLLHLRSSFPRTTEIRFTLLSTDPLASHHGIPRHLSRSQMLNKDMPERPTSPSLPPLPPAVADSDDSSCWVGDLEQRECNVPRQGALSSQKDPLGKMGSNIVDRLNELPRHSYDRRRYGVIFVPSTKDSLCIENAYDKNASRIFTVI